jgi:hypothetical protein
MKQLYLVETPQGSDPRRMQIRLTTAGIMPQGMKRSQTDWRTEEGTASATPASVASSGGDRYATRVKASAMRRRDARFAGDKMTVPARVNSYARVGKAGGTDTQQHSTAGRPYDSLQYGRVAEVDAVGRLVPPRFYEAQPSLDARDHSTSDVEHLDGIAVGPTAGRTCRYRILPRPKRKSPSDRAFRAAASGIMLIVETWLNNRFVREDAIFST